MQKLYKSVWLISLNTWEMDATALIWMKAMWIIQEDLFFNKWGGSLEWKRVVILIVSKKYLDTKYSLKMRDALSKLSLTKEGWGRGGNGGGLKKAVRCGWNKSKFSDYLFIQLFSYPKWHGQARQVQAGGGGWFDRRKSSGWKESVLSRVKLKKDIWPA